MRTRHLDEVIDAVSSVSCPHPVEGLGPARDIDALGSIAPTSIEIPIAPLIPSRTELISHPWIGLRRP
jgi:hypothetical protein